MVDAFRGRGARRTDLDVSRRRTDAAAAAPDVGGRRRGHALVARRHASTTGRRRRSARSRTSATSRTSRCCTPTRSATTSSCRWIRTRSTVERRRLPPRVRLRVPVARSRRSIPRPATKRPVVGTTFEYRLELPFTVALGGASGPGTVMCVAASPVSATAMRLFWLCAFPLGRRGRHRRVRGSSNRGSGHPTAPSSKASARSGSRSICSKSCTCRSTGSRSRTAARCARSASRRRAGRL